MSVERNNMNIKHFPFPFIQSIVFWQRRIRENGSGEKETEQQHQQNWKRAAIDIVHSFSIVASSTIRFSGCFSIREELFNRSELDEREREKRPSLRVGCLFRLVRTTMVSFCRWFYFCCSFFSPFYSYCARINWRRGTGKSTLCNIFLSFFRAVSLPFVMRWQLADYGDAIGRRKTRILSNGIIIINKYHIHVWIHQEDKMWSTYCCAHKVQDVHSKRTAEYSNRGLTLFFFIFLATVDYHSSGRP